MKMEDEDGGGKREREEEEEVAGSKRIRKRRNNPTTPPLKFDEDVGGTHIISLQDMILQKIVQSFDNRDSILFFLSAIRNPTVTKLIMDTWQRQQQAPNHTLIVNKRKFLKSDLTVTYLDCRETMAGAVISQTLRQHTTPISLDGQNGRDLMEYSLQKIQLKAVVSKQHKSTRFFLY